MTLPPYAMNQLSFPEIYERVIVPPLFQPWAEVLLEQVQVGSGDRVLDVACGTGIVARLAKRRVAESGRVVGVDVSPQMLAVASSLDPDVEWREGNAGALPVTDGEAFDVVTCQQGLQFFPDKGTAAREMRRVLAPGGRAVVATWCGLDDNPFFEELHAVAQRHLGQFPDSRHGYGDLEALAALLAGSGFRDVRAERMARPIRFTDGAQFIRLNTMALIGMSAAGKTMDEARRAAAVEAIASESTSVLPRYSDADGLVFVLTSNVATARV